MTRHTPGLLIFDCDGVLVDSEPLSLRVLIEGVSEVGLQLDPAEAQARFLGRSLASTCDILREEFGVDLGPNHLDSQRSRLYRLFREELKATAGIADALDNLSTQHCVASSSQLERIRLSLQITGLLDRFLPHIFSASMVANGKPAPDLFLYAAEQMKVDPEECTVVEDSPAGIEAAKRAGMQVLVYTGASHAQSVAHRRSLLEHQPDALFDDMRQLPALLGYGDQCRKS